MNDLATLGYWQLRDAEKRASLRDDCYKPRWVDVARGESGWVHNASRAALDRRALLKLRRAELARVAYAHGLAARLLTIVAFNEGTDGAMAAAVQEIVDALSWLPPDVEAWSPDTGNALDAPAD